MSKKVELLPVLLNGLPFTVDPSGTMAINTAKKAVRLEDQEYSKSRFK
jgi:hypothetical protein